jgi:hypothetical protein
MHNHFIRDMLLLGSCRLSLLLFVRRVYMAILMTNTFVHIVVLVIAVAITIVTAASIVALTRGVNIVVNYLLRGRRIVRDFCLLCWRLEGVTFWRSAAFSIRILTVVVLFFRLFVPRLSFLLSVEMAASLIAVFTFVFVSVAISTSRMSMSVSAA